MSNVWLLRDFTTKQNDLILKKKYVHLPAPSVLSPKFSSQVLLMRQINKSARVT